MPWELWAGARCWGTACVDLLRGGSRCERQQRLCLTGQSCSRLSRSGYIQPADFCPCSGALPLQSCLRKLISAEAELVKRQMLIEL